MIKKKKTEHMYIHILFDNFFLIFKFIFIYLLHMLFVLKIEGIFKRKKSQSKRTERCYFIYI